MIELLYIIFFIILFSLIECLIIEYNFDVKEYNINIENSFNIVQCNCVSWFIDENELLGCYNCISKYKEKIKKERFYLRCDRFFMFFMINVTLCFSSNIMAYVS